MFWKRPALPPVASFVFLAVACTALANLHVIDVWAAELLPAEPESVRASDSGEFVVALSDRCTLTSFRLPDRTAIAKFDGGECADRAVARAANQLTLYVGGRDGAINALSFPELKSGRRHRLDGAIGQLLATSDQKYLVAVVEAGNAPASLVVLSADSILPARIVPLKDRRGQVLTVASLIEIGHRRSVLIRFTRSNELWELFLAADAEPVFEGMVHDYRLGEGIGEPRNLPIRRIVTDAPMEYFMAESRGAHLSQLVEGPGGTAESRRFNLDVRRPVGESAILANFDPGTAVGVKTDRGSYWLAPDRDWPGIHIHVTPDMKYRGFVDLPGERCRVLSSPGVQSVFIASCSIAGTDELFTIDAGTLGVHAILQPWAGQRVSQVAWSGNPGYVVAVVTGESGGLVVYDRHFHCRVGKIAVPQLRKIVD